MSGLTLAGILSNSSRDVQLTVFERARRDRDQGYGLDLDEHGQEALVRAGVYDRYWDISYPYSDTSVGYQFSGGEPLLSSLLHAVKRARRPQIARALRRECRAPLARSVHLALVLAQALRPRRCDASRGSTGC